MIEKLFYISLGFNIATGLALYYAINRLYKKDSTTNNIDNLKQKNKRNKGSNIDNDIHAEIESKEDKKPKKGRLKQLFNKKK